MYVLCNPWTPKLNVDPKIQIKNHREKKHNFLLFIVTVYL